MRKLVWMTIMALSVIGCSQPETKEEQALTISAQNIAGAWQCDYALSDIKTKVHVSYAGNGDFNGRVFLNYPVTTGKGAVKLELVTEGHWSLVGTTLTEKFEVLAMDSRNSSGVEFSETLAKELRIPEELTTQVIHLSATNMTLLEANGEQTQCIRFGI
jgi:hypothetical protein